MAPVWAETRGKIMEDQNQTFHMEEITPAELASALELLIASTTLNVAIEGAPGTAKTAQVNAVCTKNNWGLVPFRLGDRESHEVSGSQMPDMETRQMVRFLPEFLAEVDRLSALHEFVIVFFDEFNKAADAATMNGARQMILDRQIEGGYTFPDNVRFVIAVNRLQDRSGDERLPSHVANSFVWLSVRPDAKPLIGHAHDEGWHPMIATYLSWRGENAHVFDPKRIVNVTFRSWEFTNEILQAGSPDSGLVNKILIGALGPVAMEFQAFQRLNATAIDHDAIQRDPHNAAMPGESHDVQMKGATMYAVVSSCVANATPDNFDAYCTFVERLARPEFEALFLRLAENIGRDKNDKTSISPLVNTAGYGRLSAKMVG